MCRSIKTLRRSETATTTGEIEAAARQYVRKVSGFRQPAAKNQQIFDDAIEEIAAASRRMLEAFSVEVEVGPDRWTPGSGRPRGEARPLVQRGSLGEPAAPHG